MYCTGELPAVFGEVKVEIGLHWCEWHCIWQFIGELPPGRKQASCSGGRQGLVKHTHTSCVCTPICHRVVLCGPSLPCMWLNSDWLICSYHVFCVFLHTHMHTHTHTQSRYSAELAMHYLLKDDYNRAKYYTDIGMQGFLQVRSLSPLPIGRSSSVSHCASA